MTFLNGLWAGQASANSDFAAIIWQLKLLGFNAIRLPFLFDDLQAPAQPIQGEDTAAALPTCTAMLPQHLCSSVLRHTVLLGLG
jgi:hypothetical protein